MVVSPVLFLGESREKWGLLVELEEESILVAKLGSLKIFGPNFLGWLSGKFSG
jgi:hypothetical protein